MTEGCEKCFKSTKRDPWKKTFPEKMTFKLFPGGINMSLSEKE